jgi:large subunit ribosomal protein L25
MELIAEKRKELGKATKTLRIDGFVPGVVFGKDFKSLPVTMEYVKFKKAYDQSGETDLIDLKVGTETYKILIKDTQFDPVTGSIIHTGLYKPDLTEKTETQIPVEVIGEDSNELIKTGAGMIFYVVDEITVKALPMDFPHAFIIDVSKMDVLDTGITVAQLDYNKEKVEIVDLEPEDLVIRLDKMEEQKEEVEVAPVSEEEAIAGVEATKEKKPEEGEEEAGDDKKKHKEDKPEKK